MQINAILIVTTKWLIKERIVISVADQYLHYHERNLISENRHLQLQLPSRAIALDINLKGYRRENYANHELFSKQAGCGSFWQRVWVYEKGDDIFLIRSREPLSEHTAFDRASKFLILQTDRRHEPASGVYSLFLIKLQCCEISQNQNRNFRVEVRFEIGLVFADRCSRMMFAGWYAPRSY